VLFFFVARDEAGQETVEFDASHSNKERSQWKKSQNQSGRQDNWEGSDKLGILAVTEKTLQQSRER
jgi:hypothetical protein